MNWRYLMTSLLTMACVGPALADDLALGSGPRRCCWTRASQCPSLGGSPDDYCPKPFPALIPVSRCGGPDDYCRKAMPCIIPVPRCGGVDDYCRKSIPWLLCPPITPYLHYGHVGTCCDTGKCR